MNAIDYIKHWEGFVPRLYLCPAGYPTIGYGTRVATWSLRDLEISLGSAAQASHLRALIENDRGNWITEEQATALMGVGVERARHTVVQTFMGAVEAGMPRWIALTDIAYNMGSFKAFPRFVEAVAAGRWTDARRELLYVDSMGTKTRYYKQTGRRAECNAQIILTGVMPDPLP